MRQAAASNDSTGRRTALGSAAGMPAVLVGLSAIPAGAKKGTRQPPSRQPTERVEISLPLEPELYCEILDAAGLASLALGDYMKARRQLKVSLDLHVKLFGPTHPLVADSKLHLATVLRRLGETDAARKLIDEAFGIIRGNGSDSTIQGGLALNELGALELQQDNLDAARSAASDSVGVLQKFSDPHVTLPMDTLARVQSACGDRAGAEVTYRAMLKIDGRTFLGVDHPRYAAHLHNLATVQQALGKLDAAAKSYSQVVELLIRLYGKSHPDLADVYANQGRLQQQIGDLGKALKSYQRALDLNRKLRGTHHPYVGYDLANLARLALQKGDARGATGLLTQALKLYRKKLPPVHGFIASALTFLGAALIELGRYAEAAKALHEAVEIWTQLFAKCIGASCDDLKASLAFATIAHNCAMAGMNGKPPAAVVLTDDERQQALKLPAPGDLGVLLIRKWQADGRVS